MSKCSEEIACPSVNSYLSRETGRGFSRVPSSIKNGHCYWNETYAQFSPRLSTLANQRGRSRVNFRMNLSASSVKCVHLRRAVLLKKDNFLVHSSVPSLIAIRNNRRQ